MDVLTHQHAVEDMEFSADGTVLGAGLWILRCATHGTYGQCQPLTVGAGTTAACFSPDGLHIATGNRRGQMRIWELDGLTRRPLENPDLENSGVSDKMLSPSIIIRQVNC